MMLTGNPSFARHRLQMAGTGRRYAPRWAEAQKGVGWVAVVSSVAAIGTDRVHH